jgi:hypothetical protein
VPGVWRRSLPRTPGEAGPVAAVPGRRQPGVAGGVGRPRQGLADLQQRRLKELRDKAAMFPALRADAERLRAWRGPDAASWEAGITPAASLPA